MTYDTRRQMFHARCKATQQWLNDVFRHICSDLPDDWEIRMIARSDEAEIELFDPDGNEVSTEWDGDGHDIFALLEHAKRHSTT